MADQDTTIGETGTEGLDDAFRKASAPAAQNIADEVGLPPRPLEDKSYLSTNNRNNDVARILGEIKLPERKEFRAVADTSSTYLAPEPAEIVPEAPIEAPLPKPRDILSPVHTLKDDFQTAVQEQKLSLVQAAALAQDKRAHQASDEISPERAAQSRKTVRLLVIIVSFVSLGIIASGATYLLIQSQQAIAPVSFLVDGLLFSEQTIPLPLQNLNSSDIKYQLGQARSGSGLTLGAIARIAPIFEEQASPNHQVIREATTQEFFNSLEARLPDELVRALSPIFFFGFHAVDENAPLFIIPVTSYERAFAGMLAWERTMNTDLSPIFTGMSVLKQENGQLVERSFTDTVMRNYDVRVLKDDTGTVQLYYSFPTRDILIIAESQYSFAEILARLRAERRL